MSTTSPPAITPALAARAAADWSKLAGEPLRVEHTADWLYAYGSELAVLRLYFAMRGAGRVEQRPAEWCYFVRVPFTEETHS